MWLLRLSSISLNGLAALAHAHVSCPQVVSLCVSCPGLKPSQAEEAVTSLLSIPVLTVAAADFVVEGEEAGTDVLEEDIVTCSLRLLLKRPSHRTEGPPLPGPAALVRGHTFSDVHKEPAMLMQWQQSIDFHIRGTVDFVLSWQSGEQ